MSEKTGPDFGEPYMKQTRMTIYETWDGEMFRTKAEAAEHIKRGRLIRQITANVPDLPRVIVEAVADSILVNSEAVVTILTKDFFP